jgi:archaetidylinositol phosphate synthase
MLFEFKFMLSKLREFSNPVFEKFSFIGNFLSPNSITLLGLLSSILGGYLLVKRNFVFSAIFFLLSGFFDLIDGIVARKFKKATTFGGVLDAVVDRYEEFVMVFSSFLSGLVNGELALITFLSMIMPSYVRARAESTGKMKSCAIGILERQEKLLLFVVFLIFQNFFESSLFYCFIIISILGQITAIQRILAAKRANRKI